jgi:hypothetical protein
VADRGVAPVVGKTLELAVAVAFVGLVAGLLYGSLVPQYRTAAGAELADRTLSKAAGRVEAAATPAANRTAATIRVDLPGTIRGDAYRIEAVDAAAGGPALVLHHPAADVGGRTRLVLPPAVDAVRGGWQSTDRAVVTVRKRPGGRRLVLEATE